MMPYRLRAGLSLCDAGSRLVFLDVTSDRYFCLDARIERSIRRLLAEDPGSDEINPDIRGLVDRGLLIESPLHGRLAVCPAPPLVDTSLLASSTPASVFQTLVASIALCRSLAGVRWRSFASNLASIAPPITALEQGSSIDRLRTIAASFQRASRWISSQDRCLAQSLAVARMARRSGIAVEIVLGVSLGPFRAHCWVQHGAAVVNDRVEIVARYTPILVR